MGRMGATKKPAGQAQRGAGAPREIELKLAFAPEDTDRILASPVLREAQAAPEAAGSLHAVYYDTRHEAFRKAGLSVRVRRKGEVWIQTVKAERGTRGLALDRNEWEVPVAGEAFDPEAAKNTALAPLLKKDGKDRIRPAFTVRTERQAFLVERSDSLIEAVLDRAEIAGGARTQRLAEVELELRAGDPAALFRLALELVETAPLRLSLATKSERGYGLLAKKAPAAVRAERIDLAPGLTTAEAFQRIARSCLSQAVRNEALLRETGDASALHQMRVGIRRLRAATSLFKDVIDDAESDGIRANLRWIGQSLGPARDLDVLIARMRKTPEGERGSDHDAVLAEAEGRRRAAYEEMLTLLDSLRFRRTFLAAATWIEAGQWLAADDRESRKARKEPIEERARAELARRWKRVLKRAKRLAELDPDARHRVRIEIKKLRYGTEFFQGLFEGKRAKERRLAALKGLENLQELLGELNDMAVGSELLRQEGDETPAAGDSDARIASLVARAQKDYRRLATLKPYWQ